MFKFITPSKLAKGILFCAGMLGGATTGNLFYLERYTSGAAMLTLTATFLFFAMADITHAARDDNNELMKALDEQQRMLASIALLLGDNIVDGFKRIGRTMPATSAELNKIEDDLMPLLSSLKVNRKDRERLMQDVDKLRSRSRQNEGRRAFQGGH